MNLTTWSNAGYVLALLLFSPLGWILLGIANRSVDALNRRIDR